ncbi:hypothetical protein XBP1_2460003 [Xenorhabdus bovienii str. puntauvense]|uniref:Uncharacterized protein n=1 Tax=Xenorhabdus bovienii str. puntauvense TaxID=1398201 RepID=A0A077NGY7_XENBV|nr:hypothetical protein XBP1_2460003 [Xenorhabdus bovienii str. puntauvense]
MFNKKDYPVAVKGEHKNLWGTYAAIASVNMTSLIVDSTKNEEIGSPYRYTSP